ncbi:MAG: flagellar motor protein MotB [Desulfobacterales bacterium]|jgi:chemotaxis protein MotB|nr:flagellar motor protein MotB [Desulfobacterales bacterium]
MARKKKQTETAAPNLIMMMTVSLFIILLAFFILLNAIAVVDEHRQRQALGSLLESFAGLSGGYSFLERKQSPSIPASVPPPAGQIDFASLLETADHLAQDIRIRTSARGSLVSLPADGLFEGPAAQIRPAMRPVLERLATLILETEAPVEISGHTDNSPPDPAQGGSSMAVSAQRALGVLRFLIDVGGVPAERITAYGRGSTQPVADNTTREGRALNQRVDVLLVQPRGLQKPQRGFTFQSFFFKVFK